MKVGNQADWSGTGGGSVDGIIENGSSSPLTSEDGSTTMRIQFQKRSSREKLQPHSPSHRYTNRRCLFTYTQGAARSDAMNVFAS